MGVLQTEFEQVVKNQFSLESLKRSVLRRAAKKKNVELSDEQLSLLSLAIGNEEDKDHISNVPVDDATDYVEITADYLNGRSADLDADVNRKIERSILDTTEHVSGGVLKSLYKDAPRMIRRSTPG